MRRLFVWVSMAAVVVLWAQGPGWAVSVDSTSGMSAVQPSLDLRLTSATVDPRTSEVVVTGTATCTAGVRGYDGAVVVSQTVHRHGETILAWDTLPIGGGCDEGGTTWSLSFRGEPFVVGRADLLLYAFSIYCGEDGVCVDLEEWVTETVRLLPPRGR